ncbi:MAG: stage V sporulation protein SpoVM [Clostridia bacterium]|nr:stage V sporulation protein SpoVM [Clostridia bacterium]
MEAICMKVVVVKSPKIIGGILRMIFGIKKNKD